MSGKVTIGDNQRKLDDANPQWVTEQITRRQRDGASVCVRVTVNKNNINVTLASGDCPPGGGGSKRALTRDESAVFED